MEQGIVCIAQNLFDVLIAISMEEQAQGLMYIEPPAPNMVFAYPEPKINKFWMARTPSPLDIVFCCQGKVSQLHVGQPYSTAIIGDDKPSDLIIEFPQGMVDKCGIKIGHTVELVKPTTTELHKIIAEQHFYFCKL
jgi:uncharacterized membrane protein (UPF0127 family)